MNRQIRRLGIGLMVCYVALFAMLNYWQVIEADNLNDNPDNTRAIERDFNRPRGTISTADGVLLAQSIEVEMGLFQYQRVYLEPEVYGHLTGFFSLALGASAVEKAYNDQLSGQTFEQEIRSFSDLFVETDPTGDVILSIEDSVQRVAVEQLGFREGSVVALDPRNGAVLAMWSFPSYDPNPLASHDFDAAVAAREELDAAPGDPLLAHSFQERYFPGSTFKVVTAAGGLDSGIVTPDEPVYPVSTQYTPPQTSLAITNFGGAACGGTLFQILAASCNTAFAEMAAETLGPEIMISAAEDFGFNDAAPLDLPDVAQSVFPTDFDQNLPALAQSGVGQNDVAATPLEMALVAAGVANGGDIMAPSVMAEIRDSEGRVIESADRRVWRTAMASGDAATLRQAMIGVVEGGTARTLAIPGMEVGGKTGTAELSNGSDDTHAWIIGFAGPPGEAPRVAVAVFVKARPGAGQQTGGTVAAPIARAVLEAALAVSSADSGAGPSEAPPPPATSAPGPVPSTSPSGPPSTAASSGGTTLPLVAPPSAPATIAPTLPPPTVPPTLAPTTAGPATTAGP